MPKKTYMDNKNIILKVIFLELNFNAKVYINNNVINRISINLNKKD